MFRCSDVHMCRGDKKSARGQNSGLMTNHPPASGSLVVTLHGDWQPSTKPFIEATDTTPKQSWLQKYLKVVLIILRFSTTAIHETSDFFQVVLWNKKIRLMQPICNMVSKDLFGITQIQPQSYCCFVWLKHLRLRHNAHRGNTNVWRLWTVVWHCQRLES